MTARAFAPAKINLFLHVGPLAADGYHPLSSWMTFADVGDEVALADQPGLRIDGPFGAGLSAQDNLVVRAAAALSQVAGFAPPGLHLHKALPIASGLGGGSSDAGAALRLLRAEFAPQVSDAELQSVAAGLGADGPACLWGRPVIAEGRGERLSSAPDTPLLDAVLVNPGVACSTGAVYRAFDDLGGGSAAPPDPPGRMGSAPEVAEFLMGCRNDLEAPALSVAPAIAEVLSVLRAAPQSLLARLSGSGATCFALCADRRAAEALAAGIAAAHPRWWIRACRLGAQA